VHFIYQVLCQKHLDIQFQKSRFFLPTFRSAKIGKKKRQKVGWVKFLLNRGGWVSGLKGLKGFGFEGFEEFEEFRV
jgi:hypothetical protein